MQISNYGATELFLTGTPEITFFKIIYRQHTNFSMESIRIQFDDRIGPNLSSKMTLQKIGDCVHKGYIEIKIPSFNYPRDTTSQEYINNLNQASINKTNAEINLSKINDFMILNMGAYASIYSVYSAENVTDVTELKDLVTTAFNIGNSQAIDAFTALIDATTDETGEPIFDIEKINIGIISNNTPDDVDKEIFMSKVNIAVSQSINVKKYFFDILLNATNIYNDLLNPNRKFAWVDKLGYSILDYIQIDIGNTTIDKHYGQWMFIWLELAGNIFNKNLYDQLIGNVPELTTFDRTTKPEYTIIIPLDLWFSKFSGLAIPLVALQYHDVEITVKLRKFSECAYMELQGTEEYINLDQIFDNENLSYEMYLSLDYIYLDKDERAKFAKTGHEYLIEQLQYAKFDDITTPRFSVDINFNHPVKEFFWFIQKDNYIINDTGADKTYWLNFTTNTNYINNPILETQLFLNHNERFNYTGDYFNYLQPYNCHNNTPADGINVYSFSINPQEHQPSGTCNLSSIKNVTFNFIIDPEMFVNNTSIKLHMFAVNYNVMRIINGVCGTAYN